MRASQRAETQINHISAVSCVRIAVGIDSKCKRFREDPGVTDSVLIQHSNRNNLGFRRSQRDQPGDVCSVSEWASRLVAYLTRIRIVVNEIKTRQQVSHQRRMSCI